MKYGINQENLKCKCANCGKLISSNGIVGDNYCSNCGAPLSLMAIAEYSETLKAGNKQMLEIFADIAKRNQTDSFVKILEIYNRM